MLSAANAAGFARAPSVPNDLMAELTPAVLRHESHQSLLDLLRALTGFREPEPHREPLDVRVYHEADVDVVAIAEHDIRGFAGHAAQLQQFFHRAGNFPLEPIDEGPARFVDRLRFAAKQPDRSDVWFDLGGRRSGKVLGLWEGFEESGGYFVHADIGCLSRENGCDQ